MIKIPVTRTLELMMSVWHAQAWTYHGTGRINSSPGSACNSTECSITLGAPRHPSQRWCPIPAHKRPSSLQQGPAADLVHPKDCAQSLKGDDAASPSAVCTVLGGGILGTPWVISTSGRRPLGMQLLGMQLLVHSSARSILRNRDYELEGSKCVAL